MSSLPRNVRIGRHGRIGILKKVPRDLWEHPRYRNKSKIIERSTGLVDEAAGIERATTLLDDCERQFAACRAELQQWDERSHLASPIPDHATSDQAGPDQPGPDQPGPNQAGKRPRHRTQMGEDSRRDILYAGIKEFSEKGLRGARIDDIAAQTQTTKPMIYYHFGSKHNLYAAVLEEAYGGMRALERELHLEDLAPDEAMRRLVEATFDHHAALPEFVRLIAVENIERGRHLSGRNAVVRLNAIALDTLGELLVRGERDGLFRPGLKAWQVHLLISSFCFMRISNRYTWRAIFDMDLWEKENAALQRQTIVEAVLRFVRSGEHA